METRTCDNCGAEFEPHKKTQRFCSRKCKDEYHNAVKREDMERGKKFRQTEDIGGVWL